MENSYSVSELLEMSLEELPTTARGIQQKAKREGWAFTEAPAKGGRGGVKKIYALPPALLAQLRQRETARLLTQTQPELLPALSETVSGSLKTHDTDDLASSTQAQRNQAGARLGVLHKVEALISETRVSKEAAITTLLTMAQHPSGAAIAQMLRLANDKRGGGASIPSPRTIKRWFAQRDENRIMAKVKQPDMRQPEWAVCFLAHYRQPQKPSVQAAYNRFARDWQAQQPLAKLPSIHQVRRFLSDKLGNVCREEGRLGKRELKTLQGYTEREFLHLDPAEIYSADGHTFDAEVLHPDSGKPFRPEITTVIDIATRKIVGWSIDLAESQLAVLDAISNACTDCGIPDILYVDNGKGYKNAMISDEATGLMGRIGSTLVHSAPYSSQARGVIERLHQTVWTTAAKMLQSYIGKDMDAEASGKVHKASRALAKQNISLKGVPALANIASLSAHMMPDWQEFRRFCQDRVNEYNERPHRSLPKVLDTSGKRRHMTPNELWALKMAQGAQVNRVDDAERHYLFLPRKLCTVLRERVRLHGSYYAHADLAQYHGERLQVAFRADNGEHVWLFDDNGRYICRADWLASNRDYFPQSLRDKAKEKRIDTQLKRLADKQAIVEAARPASVLEHARSVDLGGVRLDGVQLKAQGEAAMAAMMRAADGAAGEGKLLKLGRQPKQVAATAEAEDWQVPTLPNAQYAAYNRLKALPYEALSAAQQGFLAWCESPKGQLVMRECAELEQMLKFG